MWARHFGIDQVCRDPFVRNDTAVTQATKTSTRSRYVAVRPDGSRGAAESTCRAYDQSVPDPVTVTVMVFSSLRERLGSDRCVVCAPHGSTIAGLWPLLPQEIRRAAAPPGVRYAVDDTWAPADTPLADGDRIALVLPVSGG
jgi:molybdopterin converting factor small subunit